MDVRWGLVADTLTYFTHAVSLARGTPDPFEHVTLPGEPPRPPQPAKVPRADMEAAASIAREVRRLVLEWQRRYHTVKWPGSMEVGTHAAMLSASDATRNLESAIRQILDGSPPGAAEVRSLPGTWPSIWAQWLIGAFEVLEIIEGERPLAGSHIVEAAELTADFYDFVLTVIPGVGEFILALEAVTGYQAVGLRELSGTERAWAAVGIVLPRVLNPLVKAGLRTANVTRRALAVTLTRVMRKTGAALIQRFSIEMAIGLRVLPPEAYLKFIKLLRLTGKVSHKQACDIRFFLSRIEYGSRLAQWLRIAENQLGKKAKNYTPLLGAVPKGHEPAMLKKLSDLTGKRVVAIPETLPHDYEPFLAQLLKDPVKAKLPQVQGVKYPDAVWGDELCDLYQLQSNNVENTLKYLADKGKQASTLIVSNGPKSSLNIAELIGDRFWARPEAGYVDRVVVLTDHAAQILDRPSRYFSLDATAYAATRVMIGNPGKLIQAVTEIINEPPQPTGPGD